MKKFYFSILILSTVFFMSWSDGFTNPASGAPGDNRACSDSGCHSDGAFDPSADITLTDFSGNEITRYLPNTEYLVNVTINSSATVPPTGYGFQMVCLDDQESPINNFGDLPDGVREFSSGNRQYVVQSRRLPVNVISIPWTAPETGSVTFYSGVNAVNGNGTRTGDGATTATATFDQGSTSTEEISTARLWVFPNPVSDILTVLGSTEDTYQLLDGNGKLVLEQKSDRIDMSRLNPGLYFLRVRDGAGVNKPIVKRVIKI